jgi:predicted DNA-binding WGR domain protein
VLGLTGWTESGWSSAAAFDVLMPSGAGAADAAMRARGVLAERGPTAFADLCAALAVKPEEARSALQLECLRGRVVYDPWRDVYRPRELLATPVSDDDVRFGSERESRAHRLLEAGGVDITKLHDIAGEGIEIHGTATDREAHRSFSPRFTLDTEGRVTEASCGCPSFRRAGLREGPCEHMIALRVLHVRRRVEAEALRQTAEGRKLIRAETRTYVRRDAAGTELLYRVSLDDRAVAVRWGQRNAELREQRLWFDSDTDARDAYFRRLEALAADGYIDADADVA